MLPSEILIKKIHHFTGHTSGIFCLERGLSDDTIISGAGDGVIAEWNLDKGGNANGIARVSGNIFSLLLIKKLNLLIAGDMNGGIHTIDLQKKEEIKNISFANVSVYDLKYIENKNELLIASGNGIVYVWDIINNKLTHQLNISEKSVRNIAISKNDIAFSCSDNLIYIYNKQSLHEKYILQGHTNSVFCSTYLPEENYLISGSRDAQLKIWDVNNNYNCIKTISAHMFTINDIKLSPDGKLFATAGRDKHIKIWGSKTFNLLKVIDNEKYGGHINSVNKLFWSKWNNYLISCGDDRSVMVWEVRRNE